MEKDFQAWHNKKTEIDSFLERPFFHEREIWFCYLGANVGFEQNGASEGFLRPVIILRKFSKEILWAIPLTKTPKEGKKVEPYYHSFSFLPGITSVAVLSQIRLVDAKRLHDRIGFMAEPDFAAIKEKLKALLP